MRYCENCGAELKSNAKFCASCGARCEDSIQPARRATKGKYARKKKSKLPIVLISITLVMIVGIVVALGSRRNASKQNTNKHVSPISSISIDNNKIPDDVDGLISIAAPQSEKAVKYSGEEIRRITNNLQNLDIATDGEWLYFNHGGLCKTPLNGDGETVRVVDRYYPWGIFFLGDKLYFNFGREYMYLETDNLTANLICPIAESECFQTDGTYYYVDYPANSNAARGVYRVSVENPREYELIFDARPTGLKLQGKYLYVISAYGQINGTDNPYYGVWRIELDGSNPIRIMEKLTNYMIFSEDRIYCQDDDYSLYSIALDGSDRQNYGVKFDHGMNVSDEYFFSLIRTPNICIG